MELLRTPSGPINSEKSIPHTNPQFAGTESTACGMTRQCRYILWDSMWPKTVIMKITFPLDLRTGALGKAGKIACPSLSLDDINSLSFSVSQ